MFKNDVRNYQHVVRTHSYFPLPFVLLTLPLSFLYISPTLLNPTSRSNLPRRPRLRARYPVSISQFICPYSPHTRRSYDQCWSFLHFVTTHQSTLQRLGHAIWSAIITLPPRDKPYFTPSIWNLYILDSVSFGIRFKPSSKFVASSSSHPGWWLSLWNTFNVVDGISPRLQLFSRGGNTFFPYNSDCTLLATDRGNIQNAQFLSLSEDVSERIGVTGCVCNAFIIDGCAFRFARQNRIFVRDDWTDYWVREELFELLFVTIPLVSAKMTTLSTKAVARNLTTAWRHRVRFVQF